MPGKNIRKSLFKSYLVITAVMLIPLLYSVIVARLHTAWYDAIISNISEATGIGRIAKQELPDEIWRIVSGQKRFNEGEQYILLRKIRAGINTMQEAAGERGSRLLEVAARTETTLRFYVDTLESQLGRNASVAENEAVMEDIRGVASLLYDILQEFIVAEAEHASLSNKRIQHSFFLLTGIQLAICLIILATAMYTSSTISRRISDSISDMSRLSSRIASGDLTARALPPKVEELSPLAENLSIMAVRLKGLIDENIREQQNLQKAEMKALQAQITPHFLYNTFDTIIWLAESEQIDEVIEVTKAFSQFFRISLSKGHEWITVEQELEHVKSYLTIQKIRYADILDYAIMTDESIKAFPMLKLLLQPLVENAIYHGIKNKRGRGHITVKAERSATVPHALSFSVQDDSIGFEPERLSAVLAELSSGTQAETLTAAYGLYNVNKRLKLYYGEQMQVHIESERGKGTTVSFTIPEKAAGADNV
ncbi:MAG: sensor histidine kinase [Treponema sp.]|nr:sensor histidine kinase [Treponema sp.]